MQGKRKLYNLFTARLVFNHNQFRSLHSYKFYECLFYSFFSSDLQLFNSCYVTQVKKKNTLSNVQVFFISDFIMNIESKILRDSRLSSFFHFTYFRLCQICFLFKINVFSPLNLVFCPLGCVGFGILRN